MRLLNTETFKLEDFFYSGLPPYAVLSHTWGADNEEVSHRDVLKGKLDSAPTRPFKVTGCCERAKADGYQYVWIDTCCIDKTNSVELQEAINSMFRWYRDAAICYAYLSDIPKGDRNTGPGSAFSSSRWFQRGWTLQELIAPLNMRFYDSNWGCIGTKGDLCDAVERITGISTSFLLGITELNYASVAQRMSWAAHRITKRKEDMAYCLLGIFGVSMPMIYGEGDRAFRRLQEQIMKDIGDESILAWGLQEGSSSTLIPPNLGAALAPSPLHFANCGHIVIPDHGAHSTFEVQGGALRLTIALYKSPDTVCLGLLKCGIGRDLDMVVAIPLDAVPGGEPNKYIRREGTRPALIENPRHQASATLIQIQLDAGRQSTSPVAEACWIHIPKSVPNLKLIAVHPTGSWHKERALLEVPVGPTNGDTLKIFARFRDSGSGKESADFVAVLEFGPNAQPQCSLMIASWNTTLEEIACQPESWTGMIVGKTSAQTHAMTLGMTLEALPTSSSHRRFALKPVVLQDAPDTTVNATAVLQLLGANALLGTLYQIGNGQKRTLIEIRENIRERKGMHAQNQSQLSEIRAKIEALRAQEKRLAEEVDIGLMTLDGLRERQQHINKVAVDNNSVILLVERFIDVYNGKMSPKAREEDVSWLASQILPIAVEQAHDSLVQLLLDTAASVNVRDSLGRTALHHAVSRSNPELVLQLLKSKADVSLVDRMGTTPLSIANLRGRRDIAAALMEHGARAEPETEDGMTSLHQAHRPGDGQFKDALFFPLQTAPLQTKPASTHRKARATPRKTRASPMQNRIYDTSDSEDGTSGLSTRATVAPFEYLTEPPPPQEGDGSDALEKMVLEYIIKSRQDSTSTSSKHFLPTKRTKPKARLEPSDKPRRRGKPVVVSVSDNEE